MTALNAPLSHPELLQQRRPAAHEDARRMLPPLPPPGVRFGNLGPDVGFNLVKDTVGILGPKLLVSSSVRGKQQASEDVALEALEDVPFYLMAPVLGHYAVAPLFKRLAGAASTPLTTLGTPIRDIATKLPKEAIGAKAGAVLATTALMAGAEYLVYFAKNLVTAFAFHTRNFEAIAGLEPSKSEVDPAHDPVLKAKRRLGQVGALTAAALAATLAVPTLVKRLPAVEGLARNFLHHFDFAGGGKEFFQLSKPIFAATVASGFVASLDSARSSLERWENGLRISGVIAYLLFGLEGIGNVMGHVLQNRPVTVNGAKVPMKDLLPILDPKLFQKASVLNFSMVKDGAVFKKELEQLSHLSPEVRQALLSRFNLVKNSRLPLSALVCGIFLVCLSYLQTQWRYNRQQKGILPEEDTLQAAPPSLAAPMLAPTPALTGFGGRAPLQANPQPFAAFRPA